MVSSYASHRRFGHRRLLVPFPHFTACCGAWRKAPPWLVAVPQRRRAATDHVCGAQPAQPGTASRGGAVAGRGTTGRGGAAQPGNTRLSGEGLFASHRRGRALRRYGCVQSAGEPIVACSRGCSSAAPRGCSSAAPRPRARRLPQQPSRRARRARLTYGDDHPQPPQRQPLACRRPHAVIRCWPLDWRGGSGARGVAALHRRSHRHSPCSRQSRSRA